MNLNFYVFNFILQFHSKVTKIWFINAPVHLY